MKNTIKESVNEVYDTTQNTNARFNKNIYNYDKIIDNVIKNTSSSKIENNSKNKNVLSNTNVLTPPSQSHTSYGIYIFIGFILFIIILFGVMYFFEEKIKNFLQGLLKNTKDEETIQSLKDQLENEKKEKDMLKKNMNKNEKKDKKEEDTKQMSKTTKKEDTKNVNIKNKLDSNLVDLKQQYSNSKIVSEDSFCFIGNDNNMRHCVQAYKDDVCTSGDIYKRMDDCLIPKLNLPTSQCMY